MGFPKLKCVNTVGIRYTKGERDASHYYEVINNILDVSWDQIFLVLRNWLQEVYGEISHFFYIQQTSE